MTVNDQVKFTKRDINKAGIDLYFYNFRTLALFQYEILYQINEGLWNSSRYPQGHSDIWMEANLHVTQGKNNVRNVIQIGSEPIIKNNYNLKKLLNIGTSYNRMMCIGRLVKSCNNEDYVARLLDLEFHELGEKLAIFDYGYNEESYNEFMNELYNDPQFRELAEYLTPELLENYSNSLYYDLKDDLGMIQNTMRNTMTLDLI